MPRSICESAFQLASLAEPVATMRTPLRNEPFFAELTEQIEERYVAWYLSNRNSRSLDMSVSPPMARPRSASVCHGDAKSIGVFASCWAALLCSVAETFVMGSLAKIS